MRPSLISSAILLMLGLLSGSCAVAADRSIAPTAQAAPTSSDAPNVVTTSQTEIVTANSQNTASPTSTSAAASPTAQASPDPNANPLTGLPVQNAALLDRRPLVIKISNYPREIRPQYGLNEADLVFEYYIEWLDTRFIGVFYGNDATEIGPVRSGRYFDEHILRMFHAYYVFNFADPREYQYFLGGDLQKWMVVPGYGKCPPFFQDRVSRTITDVAHYETYFDSSRFGECLASKGADNTRQVLRSGNFDPVPPSGGAPVKRIFTHYSRCSYNYWQFDPATTQYLRFQEVSPNQSPAHVDDCVDSPDTYAPLMDALVSKQVSADNVVEIFVSHTFANAGEQQDEVYHINLVDSGKAFVFRDGVGLPARWVRTDIDQPLLITDETGRPINLRPGRTFFEVIGETSTTWSDGLDWHFDFQTP